MKKTYVWLGLFFLLIFAYFVNCLNYFPGGDDVANYLAIPRSIPDLIRFYTDLQQYRPLSRTFFIIYHWLPWNLPLLHLPSFLFHTVNTFLFFYFLSQILKISKKVAFIAAFAWAISHINFITVYTLAGISEQIFFLIFWLSLINFYQKRFFLAFLFFLLSIFTKEIFLTIPVLITAIVILDKKYRKYSKKLIYFWLPTIIFYILKIAIYKQNTPGYSYTFSLSLLLENIKHTILWLANYHHGWQMGMPLPTNKLFPLAVILNTCIIGVSFIYLFLKKRSLFILLLIWGSVSLIPFYFLNRILVHHIDITNFIVFIAVAVFLDNLNKDKKNFFLVVYIAIQIFLSLTIRNQWLNYSFSSVAAEVARNFYNQIVIKNNWKNYDQLCLINFYSDSVDWATQNGQELNMFAKKSIKIIINSKSNIPIECLDNKTLIVSQDSRSFKIIK